MRKFSLALLIVLAVGLALNGGIRIAMGHAEYARSEPAANAVVDTAPTQVRIWFTQEIFRRQGENSIEVSSADGTRVDLDDVTIDDDDRSLMTVSLDPALAAGRYTVRWRALSSEDGHAGDGEFTFTVASASTASITETVAVTDVVDNPAITDTVDTLPATNKVSDITPQPEASPTSSLPCLGGVAPLALALGTVVVRRRRSL